MNDRLRLKYLDLLKCFAILAVIFYHYNYIDLDIIMKPSIGSYSHYALYGLLSLAVPLFFMVNGALLFNRDFDFKRHAKRTAKVVGLTLIWGVITLALLMPINQTYFGYHEFLDNLWSWKLGWINHLWFFQTLAIIYIFFPLLKLAYDREPKIFYFFGWTVFLMTFGNVLILNLANAARFLGGNLNLPETSNYFNKFNPFAGFYAYALVYFMLGGWLQRKREKFRSAGWRKAALLAIVPAVALLAAYSLMMSYAGNYLFDPVWRGYDMLPTLVLSVAAFILSLNYRGWGYSLIGLIGANSLGIYLVHRFAGSWLIPHFRQLPFCRGFIANLCLTLIIAGISALVVIMLKRIPLIKKLFEI